MTSEVKKNPVQLIIPGTGNVGTDVHYSSFAEAAECLATNGYVDGTINAGPLSGMDFRFFRTGFGIVARPSAAAIATPTLIMPGKAH